MKGRRKWLIAALAAVAALVEVVGPAPLRRIAVVVAEAVTLPAQVEPSALPVAE